MRTIVIFIFGLTLGCAARGTMPRVEIDHARIREIAETASYLQGLPQTIGVTADGAHVVFLRSGPRDRVLALYVFDVASGKTRTLATSQSLLSGGSETLSQEEAARRERQRIRDKGIAGYVLAEDGSRALVVLSGRIFVIEIASGAAKEIAGVEGATDARFSPDGKRIAFVRDHDLYVVEVGGRARAITTGGTEDVSHGEPEFVAQEEMGRHQGYWWSPASDALLWEEADNREVEHHYIADPAHPEKAPVAFRYPRAGRANANVRLAHTTLAGKTSWIEWDREAFPYLAAVEWRNGGAPLLVVQRRDQREQVLLEADLATGKTRELLRERDDAWLNLHPGETPRRMEDGSFLWITDADGEERVQLRDREGKVIRVLNPGRDFRLRKIVEVHEARALAQASDDPTQSHVWEIPFSGEPKRLTTAPGHHTIATNAGVEVRMSAPLDRPRRAEVFANGDSLGVLPTESAMVPLPPNVEIGSVTIEGRKHETAIVRPRDFAAGREYPVILYVYGGPSEGIVQATSDHKAWHKLQWYADHGFIVVLAENRGLRNRGRAWERSIAGDFGSLPMSDQVACLKALGAKSSEMDLTRVGIMGWSFGGFMASLAATTRGDVFHAAVAGAPVTDWADYDTHYTERFIGTPQSNPAGYASGPLQRASGLTIPLLLIHGTADDNVYFEHSLKLADALWRAGKEFELVPLAGFTHMAPSLPESGPLIEARTLSFFLKHLQ